ncbi:MAG: TetR/AcrR family transcriptional regulator [Chloroflexi bacterium]|nr:TetR/AcrR family transcriptional regulator [Chloroflexota bacterium]
MATASAIPATRRERVDAQRNRSSIIAAAREAFERDGLSFQIDDIARMAGVGTGTIYRNFPTKQALLEAILVEGVRRRTEEARQAALSGDPTGALFEFVSGMIERSCANKGMYELLASAGVDVQAAKAGASAELWQAVEVLLRQAQEAGTVRRDMSVADLMALLTGTCQAASQYEGDPRWLTRFVQDGLRAPAD